MMWQVIMSTNDNTPNTLGRRDFFKSATSGLTAAGLMLTPRERALAQALEEKGKFDRIASCSYPIRYIFKTRANPGRGGGAARGAGAPQAAPAAGTAPAAAGQA